MPRRDCGRGQIPEQPEHLWVGNMNHFVVILIFPHSQLGHPRGGDVRRLPSRDAGICRRPGRGPTDKSADWLALREHDGRPLHQREGILSEFVPLSGRQPGLDQGNGWLIWLELDKFMIFS
jgi:hypothetical protein